ncbi:MAG: hypothetical protein D6715_10505 [Calditrichaeota bacterium]|nr:MAG: hypothetical protein D6715_10505 [Calditrichota bacterium]
MATRILRIWFFLASTVLIAFPDWLGAYRPFNTEDAYPTGKGIWNLEISYDRLRFSDRESHHFLQLIPVWGATAWLDLSVTLPYLIIDQSSQTFHGYGDVVLASKWILVEPRSGRPGIAFRGSVKLHTGDEKKGLGSGDVDLEGVVAGSYRVGKTYLHAMAGYTRVGREKDQQLKNFAFGGVALDAPLKGPFRLAGELEISQPQARNQHGLARQALLGGYWLIGTRMVLDGGVRFGSADVFPKWNWFLGLTLFL